LERKTIFEKEKYFQKGKIFSERKNIFRKEKYFQKGKIFSERIPTTT
jgi:hypothetical protein